MRLGIMQPYFFPYIGYFQLINIVDQWIAFDDVQYINHGWINRNRILSPNSGWQYIIVPLRKHNRSTLIKDIKINNSIEWRKKIIGQLEHYKKRAPNYLDTMELVNKCLDINVESIVGLNVNCLGTICDYLGISFNYKISSQCNFDYKNVNDAGEWALRICEQLNADEYVNPIGGKEIFDRNKFNYSNIKLKYIKTNDTTYSQKRYVFEPNLSIIDALMFNPVEKVKSLLYEYELVKDE